ncbi:MAG: TIR domain-containing protein [Bryobacteraceae bacterium]
MSGLVRDSSQRTPTRLFLSYSHRDEAWKDELKTALSSYERYGHLKIWDDRKIPAGTNWDEDIKEHLDWAEIVLLLVSRDYSNSKFCRWEVDEAIKLGKRVIPVYVRQVALSAEDPLSTLQGLPRDMKWVSQAKFPDAALSEVVHGLADQLAKVRLQGSDRANESERSGPRADLWYVDRVEQERQFRDFLDSRDLFRPGTPLIYLLAGSEVDYPDYLVKRLHADTKDRLTKFQRRSSAPDPIRIEHTQCPWNDLPQVQTLLKRGLVDRFGPMDSVAESLALSLDTVVVVEQRIHCDGAGDALIPVLDWYVNTLWAGVRSDTRLFVFLTLLHGYEPDRFGWRRLTRILTRNNEDGDGGFPLRSQLTRAFPGGRANLAPDAAGPPVAILPELGPIGEADLEDWLRGLPDFPPQKLKSEARRLFRDVKANSPDTRLAYCRDIIERYNKEYNIQMEAKR